LPHGDSPLRRARENAGLSVRALAEKASVTRQYIYALESGERKGSLELWQRIGRVLGIDHIEDIAPALGEEEEELTRGKVVAPVQGA
jgi:transcriptional regulator with XRE-family HTH domain